MKIIINDNVDDNENGKGKVEKCSVWDDFSFEMFADFKKKLYFCNRKSENLKI